MTVARAWFLGILPLRQAQGQNDKMHAVGPPIRFLCEFHLGDGL
jgi:hypothetical protein